LSVIKLPTFVYFILPNNKLLHQKGNIHGTKGEHPLAIEAYIVTLRIYKQHYGDSHLRVANSLFNLGVSLNAKGSPDKGLRCFVKSLRISKSKLGEDHLDVADTFEQMAISHKLMFDYNEAIMHFEKALAIRKQLSGGDLKVAAIMHEMGVVYLKESNLGSAGKAFKESLRIRKSKLSQDDSLIAESLYQLGSLYKEQNDHPNALKYFEECLKIYKSQSDASKSIKCADIFYSLGSIHKSMGNASKSLRSYNKAMSIYSEAYGPKDERVVACLARQGRVFYDSGDHNKALSCFTDCLDRTRVLSHGTSATSLAEERAYSLAQLGELYSSKGDATESSSHYSMALSAYKKLHGTDHPAVADILQKMAKHYVKNKEFDRGHSCAKEALALRNRLFGHDDSEIANSHYFMGSILFECGKYREATKYMERARRMHIEELGKMSAQVADENFLLGMICERKAGNSSNPQEDNQNELDDAAQYFQDALTARRELPGKHDVEISETLTRLGHVYYKLREYDNAVDCFSESLKLRETNRDTSSSSNQLLVADSLFDLGAALTKALDTKRALQLFTDALREYQVLLDKNDLNIAKCLGSIGEVHEKENELTEAISYREYRFY
jgi:tetratricopeptide (TPR) repeat protein